MNCDILILTIYHRIVKEFLPHILLYAGTHPVEYALRRFRRPKKDLMCGPICQGFSSEVRSSSCLTLVSGAVTLPSSASDPPPELAADMISSPRTHHVTSVILR